MRGADTNRFIRRRGYRTTVRTERLIRLLVPSPQCTGAFPVGVIVDHPSILDDLMLLRLDALVVPLDARERGQGAVPGHIEERTERLRSQCRLWRRQEAPAHRIRFLAQDAI